MEHWQCSDCGYIYCPDHGDPENGIPAGTEFGDLPDNWHCPVCENEKEDFDKL